ncbi:SIR2 family protein [Jiella sonneratiae]|uniref:SIR2 family protein n=1 Tax=Jiella sonneratiae TaxID=2816856 RepID=A0ABS3J0M8_9HYPH|nr:SIR2 family protein [Jiella sonneratiae]MBO0902695.1 SIR2 family protein [Jiella sonneratiae]
MRIRTSRTSRQWAEVDGVGEDGEAGGIGAQEAARHLSQAVRSANLVILSGLGTSLCVRRGGDRLAPTMWQLLERVRAEFVRLDAADPLPGGRDRWSAFTASANVDEEEGNLEHILSRAKLSTELVPERVRVLQERLLAVAEEVILDAVDFLAADVSLGTHANFLRRIARRPSRKARVRIFTTNYDRCFEVAAGREGFIVVDGFAFGSEPRFNPDQFNYDVVRRDTEERTDYVENLFHLLKLHGSIDWELDEASGRVVKREGTRKPLLVYPRSTKYEMAFSQPYVDIMAAFQASLRVPATTLVVIGFGFNDKHIAEPVMAAVRSNLSFNLVVVDPVIEARCADGPLFSPYLESFAKLVDDGDGRLALVEGTFEDIVPLIPDIVSQTEVERHYDRMRNITTNAQDRR